jgi:hypothetical protein
LKLKQKNKGFFPYFFGLTKYYFFDIIISVAKIILSHIKRRHYLWELDNTAIGLTTKVTIPTEGLISIIKPEGTEVSAFINDVHAPMHHLHVKPGDIVHFDLKNATGTPLAIGLKYGEAVNYVTVPPTLNNGTSSAKKYNGDSMTPMETVNLFANPNQGNMGGALGGGLGAGLVGGLLGTMLFRNGGLNGTDGTGVAPVAQVVNDSAVLTALGDIKAAIPYNEAQVQLALAGTQANIVSEISSQTNALAAGQNRDALANALAFGNVNSNISAGTATNLAATKDASLLAERNAWAITQAINNDGDRTRSLIQSIDKTNDSRLITSQANEIVELRGDRRLAEATGNITISNTNTATAIQSQNQQQQQFQILANLNAQLGNLANDIQAVRQSSVVFNSGTQTGSGNQSAANTRVA